MYGVFSWLVWGCALIFCSLILTFISGSSLKQLLLYLNDLFISLFFAFINFNSYIRKSCPFYIYLFMQLLNDIILDSFYFVGYNSVLFLSFFCSNCSSFGNYELFYVGSCAFWCHHSFSYLLKRLKSVQKIFNIYPCVYHVKYFSFFV